MGTAGELFCCDCSLQTTSSPSSCCCCRTDVPLSAPLCLSYRIIYVDTTLSTHPCRSYIATQPLQQQLLVLVFSSFQARRRACRKLAKLIHHPPPRLTSPQSRDLRHAEHRQCLLEGRWQRHTSSWHSNDKRYDWSVGRERLSN